LYTDWSKIKVVIFDVDGTLYTQSKLRSKMLFALLFYYSLRPWRIREILILHHFRAERERRPRNEYKDLENAQYAWCADKIQFPLSTIKQVVEHWIFNFPIRYLKDCIYPGTKDFFEALRKHNITIAIYSDYKAERKLEAMDLKADLIVCSTDPAIDQLKPDPRGLHYITQQLNVLAEECLFIGDRPELDGECATRANMPYLIVDKKPHAHFDFYHKLNQELNQNKKNKKNESNKYHY
jgi:phosphoglycolate phosphatase/putative hydrolase of the HAD superfamily